MRNFIFAFILSFSGAIQPVYSQQNKVDLRDVKQQVVELTASNELYANELGINFSYQEVYRFSAQQCFKMLESDSAWTDLAYRSKLRNAWPAMIHLYRTLMMSKQYAQSKDVAYLQPIYRALAFWRKHDFKSANWWHNQINVPFVFSTILLNLGDRVQSADLNYYYDRIAPRIKRPGNTGQNKLWEQDNFARLALLKNDETAFAKALDEIKHLLVVTSKEGLQSDNSFLQHGAMLQFGNYGLHFMNSLSFWIVVTQQTTYAFGLEKEGLLFKFFTQGLSNVVYQGKMDLTAIGRQIRPNTGSVRANTVFWNMSSLKRFDEIDSNQVLLSGFNDHRDTTYNVNFWRGAYMLQRNPTRFSISVKASSQHVLRVETLNGENRLGTYLSDGVTLFQTSGKEYEAVLPLLKWERLPGVTADTSIAVPNSLLNKSSNRKAFVGQVTDGQLGVSVMDYLRGDLGMQKAFFMNNNLLVAMGNNLVASHINQVVTEVNQQQLLGSVVQKGKYKGKSWFFADQKLYLFVGENQDVVQSVSSRSGRWSVVDPISDSTQFAAPMFDLYLKHNRHNNYAYVVALGIDSSQINKTLKELSSNRVNNSADVQSVDFGDKIGVVCYKPGAYRIASKTFSVDQACVFIYDKRTHEVYLADPTRKLDSVVFSIHNKSKIISLPRGSEAGSTIKFQLDERDGK